MAYIGKTPITGNFVKLDAISVVNGQAGYTMNNGGSAFTDYENVNQFLVSLNGILQAPTDSFSVSGSTLTFASNLATGDVIDFVIVLGNTLDIGTPSDATVTQAKTNFVSTSSAAGLQIKGDGTTDGTLQLNCSQNSHGIKLKSPPHSASASYTLTFPNNDGNANQVLTTDGSGVLSFADASGGTTELISHTTLDSTGVNTITTTTDWSSNNYYKIEAVLQSKMDSNNGSRVRLRNASGDISSDSYQYFTHRMYDLKDHSNLGGTTERDLNGSRTEIEINAWGYIDGYCDPNIKFTIYKPDDDDRQFFEARSYTASVGGSSNPYFAIYNMYGWCNNTDAKKGFSFYGNSSAKFTDGYITLVGYKNA
jgi:hypothetical protein